MNNTIKLGSLYKALLTLGHGRVWMEETEFADFSGYGCYREIHTWDNRTVAWWDDADGTWYLCEEVDVVTLFPGPLPEKEGELSEERFFMLMLISDC